MLIGNSTRSCDQMLFKMIELSFYRLLGKHHIYLYHKQNCICCMGKPTVHLALNENWHSKLCGQKKNLHNHPTFFFLSDYNFVGKEKMQ